MKFHAWITNANVTTELMDSANFSFLLSRGQLLAASNLPIRIYGTGLAGTCAKEFIRHRAIYSLCLLLDYNHRIHNLTEIQFQMKPNMFLCLFYFVYVFNIVTRK